jgi:hypothetical protein
MGFTKFEGVMAGGQEGRRGGEKGGVENLGDMNEMK